MSRYNYQTKYLRIRKKGDNEWQVYYSQKEAAENLGINPKKLSNLLNGKQKKIGETEYEFVIEQLRAWDTLTEEEQERQYLNMRNRNYKDPNLVMPPRQVVGYTNSEVPSNKRAFSEGDRRDYFYQKFEDEEYLRNYTYAAEGRRAAIELPERITKSYIDKQLEELTKIDSAANREIAAQIRECRDICERELKKLYELEDLQGLSVDQLLRKQRYLELRNQIDNELKKLGEGLIETVGSTITDAASIVNPHFSPEVLNAFTQIDYGNIPFSERIWHNLNELREQVYEKIEHSVVLGYSYKDAARELAERFNVSENRARCLTRTETARAYNKATEQNYRDDGIDEVEVYVERGACEDCEKLRNKKFKLGELELPLHPNCRCALLPVVRKEKAVNVE